MLLNFTLSYRRLVIWDYYNCAINHGKTGRYDFYLKYICTYNIEKSLKGLLNSIKDNRYLTALLDCVLKFDIFREL